MVGPEGSVRVLGAGIDHLQSELAQRGWNISYDNNMIHYGQKSSRARSPLLRFLVIDRVQPTFHSISVWMSDIQRSGPPAGKSLSGSGIGDGGRPWAMRRGKVPYFMLCAQSYEAQYIVVEI